MKPIKISLDDYILSGGGANGEDFIRETFHMSKSLAIRFWESFALEYFGKGIPLKEIEALICPYAGLKTIIIERDICKRLRQN